MFTCLLEHCKKDIQIEKGTHSNKQRSLNKQSESIGVTWKMVLGGTRPLAERDISNSLSKWVMEKHKNLSDQIDE